MARNLSKAADDIKSYYAKGMEEGAGPLIKDLPILFRRIEELERALAPFARIGLRDNGNLPLIQVYHKDCKHAFETLSEKNALELKKAEEQYLPAEHGF
jgi:hypothetical protein